MKFRVAMVSCEAYRDTWAAFDHFFRKFWPHQDYDLLSDDGHKPWCKVVADYAGAMNEPILLLQDDFLLTAPVNDYLIERGLEIFDRPKVGAVRLYPCPGATEMADDPYFGPVARHTAYRVSCQATWWRPRFLHAVASRFESPRDFEIHGSTWASSSRPEDIWAFNREVQPWPLAYICTAVVNGKWQHGALELCRQDGIEVDLSVRPVA